MFLKKKYITCDECKKEVWPGTGVWGSNIIGFADKEGNIINILKNVLSGLAKAKN